ncbi:hypothetical protein GCK32_001959, partial [Trichostrongylus colubriformis]
IATLTARSVRSSDSTTPSSGTSQSSPTSARKGVSVSGSGKKTKLKRFFFRIKESIGLVEKTEISKTFTESVAHLDKYKQCLDTLTEAVRAAIQENPSYQKQEHKLELAPPAGQEEYELVATCLKDRGGFDDYKNQKKQINLYEKQGIEHREYIRKARRSIQNIRSFIQDDYWVINTQRTELENLRRDMDFAKAELKAAKDEQLLAVKNQLYTLAVSAFEEKLKHINHSANYGGKGSQFKKLEKQIRRSTSTEFQGRAKIVIDETINQSDNTRALKKFFHRLKENVGLVERTEFSKELNDAFDNMDNYKLCLDRLGEAVCQVIQGNPKFRKMDHKMELAPPPDEDPYELVSAWLTNSKAFEDYKNFKTQVSLYQKQAIEHREYIRRARQLDNLRIEMDFARAELKAAKEPQLVDLKNKLYDQAVRSFEAKLKEVTKLMDAVPKNKESHLADVIEWTNCTRMYHEKMAKLLEET